MDVENALVSKLIQQGAIEQAISRGIQPEHFADKEVREVYFSIVEHTKKYGIPPSKKVVKQKNPDFFIEVSEDSLDYLIDEFESDIKRRATIDATREIALAVDDPDRVANIDVELLEVARNVATVVPSSSVSRFSDMAKRIKDYEERLAKHELPGIKTGIPTIDALTHGIQPHDFVAIAGFAGRGKTTLMQIILFNAYLQGKTSLVLSLEMSAAQLFRRWDAMAVQMSATDIKALTVDDTAMERWKKYVKNIGSDHEGDIIVIDDIGSCTVEKVWAEMYRHKPDVVAVDYIDLMDGPKQLVGWQSIRAISKGLKLNSRVSSIPVIALAQDTRAGANEGSRLENVGGSIGIAQDADIALGLFQDEDNDWKGKNLMEVRLNKNRDGRAGKCRMHWEPDIMKFEELADDRINPFMGKRD